MCGIVGVVRRRASRPVPDAGELVAGARPRRRRRLVAVTATSLDRLHAVAAAVEAVDAAAARACPASGPCSATRQAAAPRRAPGRAARPAASTRSSASSTTASARTLDAGALEAVNAALVRAKDAVWAVGRDRLRTAREVAALAGADPSVAAIEAFHSVQVALSAIDRLEVRGRDSAGLHVLVRDHGLDLADAGDRAAASTRAAADPLFGSGVGARQPTARSRSSTRPRPRSASSATTPRCCAPRSATTSCCTSRSRRRRRGRSCSATRAGRASASSPSPTRTRSTRRSSTAHDRAATSSARSTATSTTTPTSRRSRACTVPAEITTDAKVIPALVARADRRRATTVDRGVPRHGRRASRARWRIGAADRRRARPAAARAAGQRPGALRRARRGRLRRRERAVRRGRGDATLPAPRRRDARPTRSDPRRRRGQVVVLDAARAGTLDGIERHRVRRHAAAGRTTTSSQHAEITTRDIDRGDFPHYLLKEITEAPASFRKTLRGKIVERDGRLDGRAAGTRRCPTRCASGCAPARSAACLVIGQGTAAIAGQSLAAALRARSAGDHARASRRSLATELSGLRAARRHARHARRRDQPERHHHRHEPHRRPRAGRGAAVIAIVNRRNSDLVDKADGVLYTSDGRDVEMSVAVDQGVLRAGRGRLPARVRDRRRARRASTPTATAHELLDALRDAARRDGARCSPSATRSARSRSATRRRGATGRSSATARNRIAAARGADQALGALLQVDRLRRHRGQEAHRPVGRAADPRVRGRPARARTPTTSAKELAIYRAHKAAPIVIADRGRRPLRRRARDDRGAGGAPDARLRAVARWPATSSATRPRSRSTRSARPLREARGRDRGGRASSAPSRRRRCSTGSPARSSAPAAAFFDEPAQRAATTAHLEAGDRGAARVAAALRDRDACRSTRTRSSTARSARRARVVEDLTAALTDGDRGAHAPGRRDQAPGEDRHRRHLPLRRDAAAGAARAARCSRPARRATPQLPGAAHARRRSTPRSSRSPASPATGSRATRRRDGRHDPRRRPGRHRARAPVAHRRRPAPARHQAPRRDRARGHGGARPRATAARW